MRFIQLGPSVPRPSLHSTAQFRLSSVKYRTTSIADVHAPTFDLSVFLHFLLAAPLPCSPLFKKRSSFPSGAFPFIEGARLFHPVPWLLPTTAFVTSSRAHKSFLSSLGYLSSLPLGLCAPRCPFRRSRFHALNLPLDYFAFDGDLLSLPLSPVGALNQPR